MAFGRAMKRINIANYPIDVRSSNFLPDSCLLKDSHMFDQSTANINSNAQFIFCDKPGLSPSKPSVMHHDSVKRVIATKPGLSPSKPSVMYHDGVKRVMDIVFILLALPFLAPILLIVAIMVAIDGHAALYSQERIGRNGRTFRMWKFRTMVPDAKQRLDDLIATDVNLAREWNLTQKLKNDPRIIPVGHLLRKTSIDELPQLWNVLKGDMSLVGPRPMMTDQRGLYPGKAYFAMRPGLTGLWQISDRNKTTFAARADFDAAYYSRMSLLTDFRILLATVGVVIRGTGY
jgi:exopolysaccharide production protein ExoY